MKLAAKSNDVIPGPGREIADFGPGPVILFDGVCNLCSRTVGFVLRHDGRRRFRFAAMQSRAGQEFLARHGYPLDRYETFLVVSDGRVYEKSDAALLIAGKLDWPWPVLTAARAIPRTVRDAIYDLVARNRYILFGRRQACLTPDAEYRDRFMD